MGCRVVKLLELQKSRNYEKSNPLELSKEAGDGVETKILRQAPSFLTNKWGKSRSKEPHREVQNESQGHIFKLG